MENKIYYKKQAKYNLNAKEVVKILNKQPHLLIRIVIEGNHFPFRSVDPLIRIETNKQTFINNLFAEISPDNSKIIGYFPVNLPSGTIEFGYEDEIWGALPAKFNAEAITRLDRKKLPKNIVITDTDLLHHKNK